MPDKYNYISSDLDCRDIDRFGKECWKDIGEDKPKEKGKCVTN